MVMQWSPRADTSEPLITPAVALMWPLIVWLFIGLGTLITHPVSHSVTSPPIVTAEPAPTVQGQWVPLSWEISDALAEGADEPGAIPVPGDGCLMYVTEEWGVTVVCPDGSVITQDGSIIVPAPPETTEDYGDEPWEWRTEI
jgi:hypothetical protein